MLFPPRLAAPMLAAACLTMTGHQAFASENSNFSCGGNGIDITVELEPETGTATVISPRGTEQLSAESDGAWRDVTQALQFYGEETPPTLWMGSEQFSCEAMFPTSVQTRAYGGSKTAVNAPGRSLGGRLRSGPGTDYGTAGSLAEGTPVTILSNSGVQFDGYDWIEVRGQSGFIAYQWGGIMCSENRQIAGIYQQCQ